MPGALAGPAPPPIPEQSGTLSGGAPGGAPAAQPNPAPTHAQTVATLRHFAAVSKQLNSVAKNPDLGKSDVRSQMIDGITTLVADRIIKPDDAVPQLTTFPDRPYDQKQWIMGKLAEIDKARDLVLAHHAAAFAGQPPQDAPDADNHMQDMSGMMAAHYAGR